MIKKEGIVVSYWQCISQSYSHSIPPRKFAHTHTHSLFTTQSHSIPFLIVHLFPVLSLSHRQQKRRLSSHFGDNDILKNGNISPIFSSKNIINESGKSILRTMALPLEFLVPIPLISQFIRVFFLIDYFPSISIYFLFPFFNFYFYFF